MSKTYTGGYRLVSLAFADLALAFTAIAIAGLGDALGVKSRKRIVLTDIVVSGEKKNDLSVQVKKDGNNYVIEDVYGYDLSIDASGNVTSSEHSSGGSETGIKLYKHNIQGGSFGNNGNFVFLSPYPQPYTFGYDGGIGVKFLAGENVAFGLRQLLNNAISPTFQWFSTYPDAIIHTSTNTVYVIDTVSETLQFTAREIANAENVSTLVDTVTEFKGE